jgi:uncharacterized protein
VAGARIDYVELPSATAHELTRAFYAKAFGWDFTDYGPDYSAKAGATIAKPIFTFPGGRRFHFIDPSGSELAVWSDN